MSTGSASHVKVKRLELNQKLESKHIRCIIRARLLAMCFEGVKTVNGPE